jgi:hypothetical protein
MSFNYKHLKKRVGLNNAPGLKKKAYGAPRSWFANGGLKVPTPDPLAPVAGDKYLITGTHLFETGANGVAGVAEVASLQITGTATAAGNVTVTLDGIATDIAVALNDTAIAVADKIRAAAFDGWTTGGTVGTDTVTFTANATGAKADATYSAGGTGAAGTMTTTTQGVTDTTYTKGFIELYGTLDTAELTAETVGDRDSRTTNPKFVFQNPGLDAEGIEFAEMAKNDEWIILVEQLNGSFIQLGQDGLECDLVPSRSSGKVSGGYTGQTFTAESFGPVFIYQGDITLRT